MVLFDGHVHLHPRFDLAEGLRSALGNFRRVQDSMNTPDQCVLCLSITETNGSRDLERLRGALERGRLPQWGCHSTQDGSLWLEYTDGPEVLVLPGRQVATAERLEILALACTADVPDGLPLAEALDHALAADAIAVIPWGFGKWFAARGRVVSKSLRRAQRRTVFLGDNGGRLAITPPPRLFEWAHHHDILILAGSDPLPLARQERRIASYGSFLPGEVDVSTPMADIKRLIRNLEAQPDTFGRRTALPFFVANQVAMQIRKRAL